MKREILKIYCIIGISLIVISVSLYFTFRPINKIYIKKLIPAELTQLLPTYSPPRFIDFYDDQVGLLDNIIQQCQPIFYMMPNNLRPDYQFIVDNEQQSLSIAFFVNEQEQQLSLTLNSILKSQVTSKPQARFYECPYMKIKDTLQVLNRHVRQ